jgi:CheY-like chemotaxis protein
MTIRICWKFIARPSRRFPANPRSTPPPPAPALSRCWRRTTYRLIVSDLKMPKMDGLQLLSVVRRKYPELRTVVLTSVVDEQFRSRVYALGVDLYWHKPGSEQEMTQFLECMESLLGREYEGGFRGVQSKSLVDLVQLECISQSSACAAHHERTVHRSDLGEHRRSRGLRDGRSARRRCLSKNSALESAGNFEFLPAEPHRPRTIFKSYNALLLETAQAIDEINNRDTAMYAPGQPFQNGSSGLTALVQDRGSRVRSAHGGGNQD